MKKVIVFLMCCVLFVGCGGVKNDIFYKDSITHTEFTDYLDNLNKGGVYNADIIFFVDSSIKLPKGKFDLNKEKETNYKIASSIQMDEDYFFRRETIEEINKITNDKNKEHYNVLAVNLNYDKQEAIGEQLNEKIIMLSDRRKEEISFVNIKNNKISSRLYLIYDNNNLQRISFEETKYVKEKIKEYDINGQVLVDNLFNCNNITLDRVVTNYKLLEPIKKDGKTIFEFILYKYDGSITMIYKDKNGYEYSTEI